MRRETENSEVSWDCCLDRTLQNRKLCPALKQNVGWKTESPGDAQRAERERAKSQSKAYTDIQIVYHYIDEYTEEFDFCPGSEVCSR